MGHASLCRICRQNRKEESFSSSTKQEGFRSVAAFTMAKTANGIHVSVSLSPSFGAHEQGSPHAEEHSPPNPYSLLSTSHEETIHREKLFSFFSSSI